MREAGISARRRWFGGRGPGRGLALAGMALALATTGVARAEGGGSGSEGWQLLQALRENEEQKALDALQKKPVLANARDVTSGETPLHVVIAKRNNQWISYLISLGANPNSQTVAGVTPLELAVRLNNSQAADTLIRFGARVDEPDGTGETPLISAVHARNLAMVQLLVRAGASADRPDNSGRSARDYARLDGGGMVDALGSVKATPARGKTYGPSL